MAVRKKNSEFKEDLARILSERLKIILEEKNLTNKEVCIISKRQGFDVTESLLSDLLNPEYKPRWPGYDKIASIAEILDVSIDYLVGRSPVRAKDPDMQIVGKRSGLSDAAILKLYNWGEMVDHKDSNGAIVTHAFDNKPPNELINLIIHEDFRRLIDLIRSLAYIDKISKNKRIRGKNKHMGIYKTRVLVNEFGSVSAYKYILNEILDTFRAMLIDIYNIDLNKTEVRDATQADMDDF